MWNLPNILSASRLPLAFLFLFDNVTIRVIAIALALTTDYLDGFLARSRQTVTRFGTLLDPISDRFFVAFASGMLLLEHQLTWWALVAIFARDLFLFLFWAYIKLNGTWDTFRCRATLFGKVTTVVQLALLLGLILNVVFPPAFFLGLILLGVFTFAELLYRIGNLPV
ncbi:MAG: CDP-alcohol phosphatidyltransferase family protein [Chlamydiales bacterium]|nr:CDP-alcohol phosphatidyltransferase family protein [Chlamydiales bacterium]